MSFFAVLIALLIEQAKPLARDNPVHDLLVAWVRWTGRHFDAGDPRHAWVVWAVGVLGPSAAIGALWWGVNRLSPIAGFVLNVALLYLTFGFRQFSHFFTDIRDALANGDEERARRLLAEWRHLDASELPRSELLRHVIDHSLLAAHRHVFCPPGQRGQDSAGIRLWIDACGCRPKLRTSASPIMVQAGH